MNYEEGKSGAQELHPAPWNPAPIPSCFNPKFAFGTDHKMKASLKELKS
jgi:hypothetical protein